MSKEFKIKEDEVEVKDDKLWMSTLKTFIVASVVTLSIVFGMKSMGIYSVNLSGESMAPTFHDGTFMLIKEKTIEKDDIIVFTSPESWSKTESSHFIKRVIGVPGDKIIITRDGLLVNDNFVKKINNSYFDKFFETSESVHKEILIPDDKYFVVGDNYARSNDSMYQMFTGNQDFLVDKDLVFTSGDKLLSVQYKPNFTK